ncbi:MAG: molecular chaperone TorD family protein [Chloroflexi bacterium]|nr:molecular chaperone TorD family protein [Chloroflexota bacterium]MCL5075609.1 molecular chaperone TorD family protein [Chloroflexota bacterium]
MMSELNFLHARAAMYDLLARLYTYPLDSAALDAVMALRVENAPTALFDALVVMQARIAAAPERAMFVETLNVEATRLFEGPGQPAAPAYASFYLNERQLMGPAALAARRAYLAWNVRPRDDGRVPPDHLALELGFMAYLAYEIAAHDGESPRALAGSATFLREHLLTWVPRFGSTVVSATAHPFFIGLANLTCALLESDAAWLREILEVQKHPIDTEVTA